MKWTERHYSIRYSHIHRVVGQIQSCGAGRGSFYERQRIIMIYELKFPVDLLPVLWNVWLVDFAEGPYLVSYLHPVYLVPRIATDMTRRYKHTDTRTYKHIRARARTHTHTHARTHARAHTHTIRTCRKYFILTQEKKTNPVTGISFLFIKLKL